MRESEAVVRRTYAARAESRMGKRGDMRRGKRRLKMARRRYELRTADRCFRRMFGHGVTEDGWPDRIKQVNRIYAKFTKELCKQSWTDDKIKVQLVI